VRNFILAVFSLLIILPVGSVKAQDSSVLIKFSSFYLHPSEDVQDCASTGRFTSFDANLDFKNGSRVARWEGSTSANNGKMIRFRIELVRGPGAYQMTLTSEDERLYPMVSYRTTFAPTDTVVTRGFVINAFSDLPICRENLVITVNSINFGSHIE
jgi:hypothetical protein